MDAQEQQLTEEQLNTPTATGQTENADVTAATNTESAAENTEAGAEHDPNHPKHHKSALQAANVWHSSVNHARPHHDTSLDS